MARSFQFSIFPFLFVVYVLNLVGCSSSMKDIKTDQDSLLALKSHITSDPSGFLTSNWTRKASVCSWIGVTCGRRHHRVTELSISYNCLVGILPPEIGNLSFLVSLNMSDNSFHGDLPGELGRLHRLKFVDLTANNFTGEIPEVIGNLSKLEELRLGLNQLSGRIPLSIFNISSLTYITLRNNHLSGSFPVDICRHLRSLEVLSLRFNNFRGELSSSLGLCSQLENLLLEKNNFIGIIPREIGNMTNLVVVKLASNNFYGEIPECLGNLSRLMVLGLKANHFHGVIPTIFTKDCTLQFLNLNGNKLEGVLPKSMANCAALQIINIGNNQIRDKFPSWMETLSELRVLILRSNRFHGTIFSISKASISFPKLQVFDISHNEFIGSLPAAYLMNFVAMINATENTTQEIKLYIHYEENMEFAFKGVEQPMERIMKTFIMIDLSVNKFNSSIPDSVGKLNSLKYLNLSHNNLTGGIPASLGNVNALESLDLSSNQLVGRIPQEMTKLTFLSKLNFSNNNLVGLIPQSHQFSTFENSSYMGNLGLCGSPLMRKCDEDKTVPKLELSQESDDSSFIDGFTWRSVILGYGFGTLVGIVVGHLIFFRYGRPRWFVNFFLGPQFNPRGKRRKNVARVRT